MGEGGNYRQHSGSSCGEGSPAASIVGTISGSQCLDKIGDALAELVSHIIAYHIELFSV
jgi:hypothetical protein